MSPSPAAGPRDSLERLSVERGRGILQRGSAVHTVMRGRPVLSPLSLDAMRWKSRAFHLCAVLAQNPHPRLLLQKHQTNATWGVPCAIPHLYPSKLSRSRKQERRLSQTRGEQARMTARCSAVPCMLQQR